MTFSASPEGQRDGSKGAIERHVDRFAYRGGSLGLLLDRRMMPHAAYIRKNTMISIVISMVISAVFFWLVFGSAPLVPVFGGTSVTMDFIPQTLAAGFMAAFVPALQTRAKIKAGQFAGATPAMGGIVVRSIALAMAALVLAAVVTGALWIMGSDELPWSAAFIVKVIYGGLLGLIITPIALRALLRKG